MSRMTVEEIYRGEKYDVMSVATADYLMNGRPSEYDERTWLEMLLVKHTLITAEKICTTAISFRTNTVLSAGVLTVKC